MAENYNRPEHREAHPQAQHRTQCGCGQELDICSHGHCPRCGHRIEVRELAAVG